MNTQEDLLLAKFMNLEFDEDSGYWRAVLNGREDITHEELLIDSLSIGLGSEELLFATSWSWLMPVVQKCLRICHEEMLNEFENGFSDAFMSINKEKLHKEAVSFATWWLKENNSKTIK